MEPDHRATSFENGLATMSLGDARSSLRPADGWSPWDHRVLEGSIGRRFETIVERFPDRPAIEADTSRLTYRDLDRFSAAIGAAIVDGGSHATCVGLLFDQGPMFVAAMLGAIRAGAVVVPLDPAYPDASLAATLDHARADVVLGADETLAVAQRVAGDRPVIDVGAVDRVGARAPLPDVDPGAAATLFYTSGSTGRPKGVLDSHRNILDNIGRYTDSLAIGPTDRLTLIHGPTFSGIVSSLFGALLNGAAILPFDLRRRGLDRLGVWLAEERATMLHCVPTVFRAFLVGQRRYADIRVVRLEGDLATWTDVERFRRHFVEGSVLVNGLGATETGLTRQFFVDHVGPPGDGGSLPIGYAVPGIDVAIVGPDRAPAAVGEPGEIVVSGRHLAIGYLRDPERTDTAFGADPNDPDRRTYRTGDLGRLDADGRLHHLGRVDAVHKVRGMTVDPGEVELALLSQPGISGAVAVTRDDGAGEVRLVAYVVSTEPVDTVAIRGALAAQLPVALVPSAVIVIDAIPVTSAGKVDRAALPSPDRLRPRLSTPYRSPVDPLEEEIAAEVATVLDIRPVGVDDDFFELGGDSLAAANLLLALGQAYAIELPPEVMVRATTASALAGHIRAASGARFGSGDRLGSGAPSDELVTLIQADGPAIFAIHADPGKVAYFAALARNIEPGIAFHSLQPPTGYDEGAGEPIPTIAARYVELIRRERPEGPYIVVGFCYGALIAFEVAHQLRRIGERADVCLLAVGPLEFPTLISPAALARYRRGRWRRRLALGAPSLAADGPTTTARRAAAGLAMVARRAVFRGLVRVGLRRPHAGAPDIRAAKDLAAARYQASPYPGRMFVVVARDNEIRFLGAPRSDLAGLASGGVEVMVVPGDDHAMLVEPLARTLGATLSSRALRSSPAARPKPAVRRRSSRSRAMPRAGCIIGGHGDRDRTTSRHDQS